MSTLDNIRANKYKPSFLYPTTYEKTDSISQNEQNKNDFFALRKAWNHELHRLEREVFPADLEAEFSLLHHQHEKVWDIAWVEGHSEGLEAVYRWYERLADLFAVEP
jgi:hypothetical protein